MSRYLPGVAFPVEHSQIAEMGAEPSPLFTQAGVFADRSDATDPQPNCSLR